MVVEARTIRVFVGLNEFDVFWCIVWFWLISTTSTNGLAQARQGLNWNTIATISCHVPATQKKGSWATNNAILPIANDRDGQLMLIIPWLYHGYSLLWHDVKWCMGQLMLGFATTQTVRCSPCHGYSSRRAQQLLQVIHFLFIQKNLSWCVSINGGMWRWGPINILLLVVEPGYISNMFRNLWIKHGRQPTHRGACRSLEGRRTSANGVSSAIQRAEPICGTMWSWLNPWHQDAPFHS